MLLGSEQQLQLKSASKRQDPQQLFVVETISFIMKLPINAIALTVTKLLQDSQIAQYTEQLNILVDQLIVMLKKLRLMRASSYAQKIHNV